MFRIFDLGTDRTDQLEAQKVIDDDRKVTAVFRIDDVSQSRDPVRELEVICQTVLKNIDVTHEA